MARTRRFRKGHHRTHGGARKRFRARLTARKVRKIARRAVKKMAEKKFWFDDGSCVLVNGRRCGVGTDLPLASDSFADNLSQGLTDVDRIGDKITMMGSKVVFNLTNSGDAATYDHGLEVYPWVTWRIMVVEFHETLPVDPDDIWERESDPLASRAFDRSVIKKVYLDRLVTIRATMAGTDDTGGDDIATPFPNYRSVVTYPRVMGPMVYKDGTTDGSRHIRALAFNDALVVDTQVGAIAEIFVKLWFIDT